MKRTKWISIMSVAFLVLASGAVLSGGTTAPDSSFASAILPLGLAVGFFANRSGMKI